MFPVKGLFATFDINEFEMITDKTNAGQWLTQIDFLLVDLELRSRGKNSSNERISGLTKIQSYFLKYDCHNLGFIAGLSFWQDMYTQFIL